MEYRNYNETYYIRLDRNDEIISSIIDICKKENIRSATFSGIGGCSKAEIQTFIPSTSEFETSELSGMPIEVLYTAEIELRPVINGVIGRKYDPETGTGFWDFK